MKQYTIFFVIGFFLKLFAQNNDELQKLSLEELIDLPVTITNGYKELKLRESPGITTVITAEDIEKSGARDLIDVLRLVPGFDFGVDVGGVVGIGMRGLWAHEGKLLLLFDGQEFNEDLYSCNELGNHFQVAQIKKIEIIRGPGSAIYGGNAELGVINIITKNSDDFDGYSITGTLGHMQEKLSQKAVSVSFNKSVDSLRISINANFSDAIGSDRKYFDLYGNSYNMGDYQTILDRLLNVGLDYKNTSARIIIDKYRIEQKDAFTVSASTNIPAFPYQFDTYLFEFKQGIELSDKLKITPKFNYKYTESWNTSDAFLYKYVDTLYNSSKFGFYDLQSERITTTLTAEYSPNSNTYLVLGAENYWDNGKSRNRRKNMNNDGDIDVNYRNLSIFSQCLYIHSLANLTLGARFEKHNVAGSSFVPRIALTKVIDNYHLKVLYSWAFRTPSIMNIGAAYQNKIEPEKTKVLEFEVGTYLFNNIYMTANYFDIIINNPIYYYVESSSRGYKNCDQIGSQGIETEIKYRNTFGNIIFNYSYYGSKRNTIFDYQVNINSNSFLGLAQHKFNLYMNFFLSSKITVAPSINYIGERYYIANVNNDIAKANPSYLLNFSLLYNSIFENLNLKLGFYNLLNDKYGFIQPYKGGHAILPAGSREIQISANYNIEY